MKKLLKKAINHISKILYYETTPKLARFFQRLFPINRKKLLIIGSPNVSDLQLQLLHNEIKNYPDIKVNTYKSYFAHGPITRLITIPFHLATSHVIVLEDAFRPIKYLKHRGQIVIQMWHALGAFKRFGLANEDALKQCGFQEQELRLTYHYDYILDPGMKFRSKYQESFNKDAKVIEGVFNPRLDVLLDKKMAQTLRQEIYKRLPQLMGKKVLLYTPTYRGLDERNSTGHFIDFDAVLDRLSEDYVLILKKHPSMVNAKYNQPSPKNAHRFFDLALNVNELMLVSDILINDYSSTFFEFALSGKPCMFFARDIEDYIDERGFYFKYLDFVPGPISYTEEELANHIITQGQDTKRVQAFVNEYFGPVSSDNTKLFAEFIRDRLNKTS